MFSARWNSVGIGFNGAGLHIAGDTPRYVVRWGEGAPEAVRADRDDDGDDSVADVFHSFASDGTYDVSVSQVGSGLPAQQLRAYLYTGATTDVAIGGSRLNDVVLTGTGNDNVRSGDGDDAVATGVGNDRIDGGGGEDFLLGGAGNDVVRGGAGSDLLGGDVGDDLLYGDGDRDFIYGDVGRDQLFGGDGDDYLEGGAGVDRLTGGAGADTFEFAPIRDAMGIPDRSVDDPDRDAVLDYVQGTDHLSIDQWSDRPFTFVGTGRFTGDGPSVRYANAGGVTIVFGDADGDRVADFSVRIEGNVTLTEADFIG